MSGDDDPEAHEQPYTPREHDHLVEPMFSGLGVEPEDPDEPDLGGPPSSWWRRLLGLLILR